MISRVCLYILYKVDYIRVIITTNKDEGSEKKQTFVYVIVCSGIDFQLVKSNRSVVSRRAQQTFVEM